MKNKIGEIIIPIKFGDYISEIKDITKKPKRKMKVRKKQRIHEYVVQSVLINDIYGSLFDSKDMEKFCLVSGIRYRTNLIPFRLHEPELELRSSISVKALPVSVYDIYEYNQKWGLNLLLMCHSHPGDGPNSVYPSMTDLKNLKTWENNFQLVGLIMNRAGYFRFFSSINRKFIIKLIGKGVERIDETVYRLNHKKDS